MAAGVHTHSGTVALFLVLLWNISLFQSVRGEILSLWNESAVHWTEQADGNGYSLKEHKLSWWESATKGCPDSNLLIVNSTRLPTKLGSSLPSGTYWIAGAEFPMWAWSGGHKQYRYCGSMEASSIYSLRVETGFFARIEGISALACHKHCGKEYTTYGMWGRYCFCLPTCDNLPLQKQTSHNHIRCPGNYFEYCGNLTALSVYETDHPGVIPSVNDKCAFIQVFFSWGIVNWITTKMTLNVTDQCETVKKCSVFRGPVSTVNCNEGICLLTQKVSWSGADRTAELLTVTRDNWEDIQDALDEVVFPTCRTYWVGLHEQKHRLWIDGTPIHLHEEEYASNVQHAVIRCLAIKKTPSSATYYWSACESKHRYLCQTPPPSTTTLKTSTPSTSPPSSTTSTTTTGQPPTDLSTSRHPSTTVFTSGSTNNDRNYTFLPHHDSTSNRTGVYVGGVLGGLLLVTVVLGTVLFFYRTKRACFQSKPDVPELPVINPISTIATPQDEDGYMVPQHVLHNRTLPDFKRPPSVPIATIKPNGHIYQKTITTDAPDKLDSKTSISEEPGDKNGEERTISTAERQKKIKSLKSKFAKLQQKLFSSAAQGDDDYNVLGSKVSVGLTEPHSVSYAKVCKTTTTDGYNTTLERRVHVSDDDYAHTTDFSPNDDNVNSNTIQQTINGEDVSDIDEINDFAEDFDSEFDDEDDIYDPVALPTAQGCTEPSVYTNVEIDDVYQTISQFSDTEYYNTSAVMDRDPDDDDNIYSLATEISHA